MEREEIIKKIVDILKYNIPEAGDLKINRENAEKQLEVGSLIFLQLLTEVEKEFQIHIEDDYWEYDKLSSIGVIADYVLEAVKEKRNQ